MFLSDEGPTLETLDFTVPAVHQPVSILIHVRKCPFWGVGERGEEATKTNTFFY